MSRPLVTVTVCYISGILTGYLFQLPLIWLICLTCFTIITGLYNELRAWKKNRLYFYLAVFLLGVIFFQLEADRLRGNIDILEGETVVFCGTVTDEPDERLNYTNYVLRVEQELTGQHPAGSPEGSVLVSVRGPAPQFSYGDRLQVVGVALKPEKPGNPGEFDYRGYLGNRGIQLVVKSRQGTGITRTGIGDINLIIGFSIKLKQKLTGVIRATMPEDKAALMEGILFGSRGRIDDRNRDDFALTGVMHLLSVSGYHVGLVIGFTLISGKLLGLGRISQTVFIIIITSVYTIMTGAGPPVVRAVIMAWVLLLARAAGKSYHWPSAMSLAAVLVLMAKPHALFTAGFQLSFVVTWGILYLGPFLQKTLALLPRTLKPEGPVPGTLLSWAGQAAIVTLAAQIAVLTLTAYYFGYFSPVALIANLMIVPLISLVMLVGGCAAIAGVLWIPLAGAVNVSTGLFLELALAIAAFLAQVPFAAVTVKQPGIIQIIVFYLALIFIVESFQDPELSLRIRRIWALNRLRLITALLVLAALALWAGILWPRQDEIKMTFIDIGQGDAVLVESPSGRSIVLDTGGAVDTGGAGDQSVQAFNPGEKVLLPFLRYSGISTVDLLILSHPHTDHIQGAWALLDSVTIRMLAVSPQFTGHPEGARLVQSFAQKGTQIRKVSEGETILFGENIVIEVLSPHDGGWLGENDNSLVVRLCFGELHVLFTGDAEQAPLEALVKKMAGRLHAEIIKVPHHGSANAWVEQLYREANPKAAVISVGPNVFRHPSPRILDGLARLGIPVLRTDRRGAVIIRSDGKGFRVDTMKGAD